MTVRDELSDLHQRVLALQVMITALIDSHPAPAQLDSRLAALIAASMPAHAATRADVEREISGAFRASEIDSRERLALAFTLLATACRCGHTVGRICLTLTGLAGSTARFG